MKNDEKRRSGPGFFSFGVLLTSIALVGYLVQQEFKALMLAMLIAGAALMAFEIFRSRRAVVAFLADYWLAIAIVVNGALALEFATAFGNQTGLTGMRLWLGVVGVMIALDGIWALLYTLTKGRGQKRGTPRTAVAGNVAFLFKLGLVLLALVNWFGANWLPTHLGTIDTTETQVYTLGDRTKQILDELGEMPGRLTATYVDFGTTMRAMRGEEALGNRGLDFLKQYSDYSPHFKVKSFNGVVESQELKDHFRALGIVKPDLGIETTVVFTYLPPGEDVPNRKDVTVSNFNFIETTQLQTRKFKGEQLYTSAIQDVIYPRKKVYFVKGHGEFETTGSGEVNLSDARELTRKLALETADLSIAEKGRIPRDADLLIIAGPETPLLKEEVEILTGYLEQGGSLILMVGPQLDLLNPGAQYVPFGLEDYLFKLGVRLRSDMVCIDYDPSVSTTGEMSLQRGLTILTGDYSSDPIVRDLARQGLTVRFPDACPVMVEEREDAEGVTVEPLVYVRRNWPDRLDLKSYGAKLFPGRDPFREDPRNDLMLERMSIAVSAEKRQGTGDDEKISRIVVFGGARFATTFGLDPRSRYYAPGNSTLYSNAVSWAVKRESLIAIDAKTLERESVALEEKEIRLAQVIGVYAVPGFVLLLGIAVWWWRRR